MPGVGVQADTKMMSEVANAMMTKFDKEDKTLMVPQVYETMFSVDANIEIITSSTI